MIRQKNRHIIGRVFAIGKSLILFAVGLSLILVANFSDLLSSRWAFIGALAVIVGAGLAVVNVMIYGPKILQDAEGHDNHIHAINDRRRLGQVARRISLHGDHRDRECLRSLRLLYDRFSDLMNVASETIVGYDDQEIQTHMRSLFWTSVDLLDRSVDITVMASALRGDRRCALVAERSKVFHEVRTGVYELEKLIVDLYNLGIRAKQEDFKKSKSDLTRSLRVLKRVDDRLHELHHSAALDDSDAQGA